MRYIGLAVAFAFIGLTVINLEGQGAYYDELHQAPAAFNYLGGNYPTLNYDFLGIPILNMSYSGAIKSNIYGLYLKFVNPHFTIYSWRLTGILFVAIALVGFYWFAGPSLPPSSAVLFGALILTDASILLATRHDWGPAALAFALRLAFLAAWLRSKYFPAGLVIGIAVFEKVSSMVLLAPLCLWLATSDDRNLRVCRATGLGFAIGVLPLLVANAGSVAMGYGFVSLSSLGVEPVERLNVSEYAFQYLSLGNGAMARSLILGDASSSFLTWAEAILILALLAIIIASGKRPLQLPTLMAASYLLIGVSIYIFPKTTFVHHWLLGNPFHYAAIALALGSLNVYRKAFLVAVVVLLALRIPNLVSIEQALASGRTSERFHPVLTRLAELAVSKSKDSVFIAADWGAGIQVYCLGNGQDGLLYEPFSLPDPTKTTLQVLENTKKRHLYTLVTGMAPQFQDISTSILDVIANHPDWQEAPLETEFDAISTVQIRKFVRRKLP